MKDKESEYIFSKEIKGDSLIQLKDGKLLFYHFIGNPCIYTLNEKIFHKIMEIDFDELFNKSKKENKSYIDKIKNKESLDYYEENCSKDIFYKNSIIE